MNDRINHYRDTQQYPCLIFVLMTNPDFGKTFDIANVEKPSEQLYDYVLCDFATLGKSAPSYEEWAKNCQENELKSLITSSTCELKLCKCAVESFDSIEKLKELEGFLRYADQSLNEYFGVNQ